MSSTTRRQLDAWRGFAAWALSGFLTSFAVITGFSIGVLILPFAIVSVAFSAMRAGTSAGLLGFPLGVGITALAIGVLHWGDTPCREQGSVGISLGETSGSCGGFDPVPWLVAGLIFVAIGVVGNVILRSYSPPGR